MRKRDLDLFTKYGVNNAEGVKVAEKINGKWVATKPYKTWKNMMYRCSGNKKGYDGVTVCNEWSDYDGFYKWFIQHDYEGAELDKDWLVKGNRHYSPETCVMMPQKINRMLHPTTYKAGDSEKTKGQFFSKAIGVADGLKIMGGVLGKTLISDEAYNAVLNYKY